MLEVARILSDITRIQNELDELEKCSEINQIEFVKTIVTVSTKYSNEERNQAYRHKMGTVWLGGYMAVSYNCI